MTHADLILTLSAALFGAFLLGWLAGWLVHRRAEPPRPEAEPDRFTDTRIADAEAEAAAAAEALEQARIQLVDELHAGLTEQDRAFLLGVAAGEPDWALLPLQGVAELPAVRWKLHNIAQMEAGKRRAAVSKLEAALATAPDH